MRKHQKLSTTELRQKNKSIVYKLLYDTFEDKTKQDIALELNLSLPTVSQNLNELLDDGLIEYSGFIGSNGGRRARTIRVVSDAKIAIGIEISKNSLRFAATDLYGNEISYNRIDKIFEPSKEYKEYVNYCLENFINDFSINKNKILGIGITLPAIISADIIKNSPVLGLKNMPIENIIGGFEYPFYVLNDANAGGYAECFFQKQNKDIAYLFIEKGVGGSIIIDSKAYNGKTSKSAEFGHICIQPNGKSCFCGKKGCLEAYCSTARLSDDLNTTTEEFFYQLSCGNEEYKAIFDEYLNNLAKGINTIKMVLDCDIVIGGSISPELSPYLPTLKQKVKDLDCFSDDVDYIRIGSCGTKANCIGAALHYVLDFLNTL